MEQLKLEHLAPYLPYGLKFWDLNDNRTFISELYQLTFNKSTRNWLIEDSEGILEELSLFKPVLRPLSDLTEEIEHNGEKFVPIEKLKSDLMSFWCDSFDDFLEYLHDGNYESESLLQGSYRIVRKLQEWHFDTDGLIEKGLAIDINTL